MGFLFGLLIGAAASSGGSLPPSFGTIPFRCLAAFDISEADYRVCRRNSLRAEIFNGPCNYGDLDKPDGPCSIEKHFAWEIAGLRDLKHAIEARRTPVGK